MDQRGVASRSVVYDAPPPYATEGGAGGGPHPPAAAGKGRWAWVWGISGTLLSAGGFIALTLFEQYNSSLNELQRDLKHFNEVSAEFVKKEHFKRVIERLEESTKELQASAAARAQLEKELDGSHKDRREMEHDLQRMRERLAAVEGRQAAPIIITTAAKKK